MIAQLPNPDTPLPFEFLDDEMETGKSTNPKNEKVHAELMEELKDNFPIDFRCSPFDGDTKDSYVDTVTYLATNKILGLWNANSRVDVIAACKTALDQSPVCTEAYLLMGYHSKSYEEALENFNKAIEVFPKSLKPKALKASSKDIFKHHESRTLFYALLFKANVLRKTKQYQESLKTFMELSNSVSEDSNFSSNYINFRAKIPEVMMRLGKYTDALGYMNKYPESTERNSSVVDWNMNRALINFKLNRHDENFAEKIFHGMSVAHPLSFCSELILYLTGEIQLPHQSLSLSASQKGGKPPKSLLACYVKSTKDLWTETKGAVEWLSRNTYTLALLQIVGVIDTKMDFLGALGLKKNFESFKMILTTKNPFLKTHTTDDGCTLVNSITMNCPFEYLKYFVELGNKVVVKYYLQPIHMACYYDLPIKTIDFLIEHGADPIKKYPKVNSAYDMALNQGNWLPIQYLLSKYKSLSTRVNLKNAFSSLCGSSCFFCLAGGRKCERCTSGSGPHSKNVSFQKCVQMLVKHGLDFIPDEGGHPLEKYLKSLLYPESKSSEKNIDPSSVSDDLKQLTIGNQHVHGEHCNHDHDHTHNHKHSHGGHIHSENCNHNHHPQGCRQCGKQDNLKLCSGCKKVNYCSRECQVSDWKRHKAECKKK